MAKVKTVIIIYDNGEKQFFNYYKSEAKDEKKKGKGAALGDDVAMGYEEAKEIMDSKPKNYTELKRMYERLYYD